ncbi:MAG: hypothetical protein ACE5OO_06980, partial [Candidatus Bathyarchaeia archaeon]
MAELHYILGGIVSVCTVVAYVILLSLGRRWRAASEREGLRYWTASKERRVEELTEKVWRPGLVTVLYGLAYFSNGFTRIAFSIWLPFFLFQVRGLGTMEVALFIGIVYASWGWKMFIGIVADALPMRFRGRAYRRLPWFFIAGVLYAVGVAAFIIHDPGEMPVWSALLPTITL